MFRSAALPACTAMLTLALATSSGVAGTSLDTAAAGDTFVSAPTIDRMTTQDFVYTNLPGYGVTMGGHVKAFYLNDGTSWSPPWGSGYSGSVGLDHVVVSGDSIWYVFDGSFYVSGGGSGGGHSTVFTLASTGPLVLFAYNGSTNAMLYGQAEVVSNTRDWTTYAGGPPPFSFFSSIVGSTVPFILSYLNYSETWTPTSFDHSFQYTYSGVFDFAHPVAVPPLVGLAIRGSNSMPSGTSVQFHAIAQYANAVELDVTDRAAWSMASSDPASQYLGRLTVGALPGALAHFALEATYSERGETLVGLKHVTAYTALGVAPHESWPMYQCDAAHSGYQPVTLDPASFHLRWSERLGEARTLDPLVAADGRVYAAVSAFSPQSCRLLALDAATGSTVWSHDFGRLFRLNPPAFAYGNVYVQVSDGADSTSLQGFDGATGELLFVAPHGAQWGEYLAPTISGRLLAVDAGVYEGMFGFDPLSGDLLWLQVGLPQADLWTPAIDDRYSYTYIGNSTASLFAVDRTTGSLAFQVADPSSGFARGYSPVLGGAGELLVINNNRLIAFDLPTRSIRWQVSRLFTGQPVVARGVVYAIDNGKLVAIDESTHADLWTWQPLGEALAGTMIVTDSHVFACTPSRTYAVDLASHTQSWFVDASGAIALAEGSLLVATSDGQLLSIAVEDIRTEVTLVFFDATDSEEGIELQWQLARSGADPVEVERAPDPVGPWSPIVVHHETTGATTRTTDTRVESGRDYWYRLIVRTSASDLQIFGPVRAVHAAAAKWRIAAISPNPLRLETNVQFSIPATEHVWLGVYDLMGRQVESLADGVLERGAYQRTWRPAVSVSAGIYVVRFASGSQRLTRKIALVR
jgi:hypothetical protein